MDTAFYCICLLQPPLTLSLSILFPSGGPNQSTLGWNPLALSSSTHLTDVPAAAVTLRLKAAVSHSRGAEDGEDTSARRRADRV